MNILVWAKHHWFFIFLICILFLPIFLPSEWLYFVKNFIEETNPLLGLLILGILFFISTVIAPLNTLILIPFASSVFGWKIVFVLATFSWTLGAVVAFLLARYFGENFLRNFKLFEEILKFSAKISNKVNFLTLVFLRVLLPVDILSYAVGFLTKMPLWQYTLATLIGVIPFSFLWSFGGEAAFNREYATIFTLALSGIFCLVLISYFYKRA